MSKNYSGGKLPPQALDLEEHLLAAIMLNRNAIYDVLDLIKPEMFYKEAHQIIYNACLNLHRSSNPVDMTTVIQELRKMGMLEMVGGNFALMDITDKNKGFANFEYWCRIIMEKHLQRELIRSSQETINLAYDDTSDPFELLGNVSKFVSEAEVGFIGSSEQKIGDIAAEVNKMRETDPGSKDGITGLPSGIDSLDKLLDGFIGGELITIGARPAMGKTAAICAIAKHINIDRKEPLAIFSLEMSGRQLFYRLESNVSGVARNKIKDNNLTDHERQLVNDANGKLSNGSLIIDDKSSIKVSTIVSRIRMYIRKYGIKGVIIDYLGLIAGEGSKQGNREQELAYITRSLKIVAQDLNIPVILLSQLSREVEKRRPYCIPQLADLRESGAIEQDSDKVLFLWRPEYYLTDEMQNDSKLKIGTTTPFRLFNKHISNKNLLVYIIAKHREGELGSVPSYFTPWNMRITEHPDLTQQNLFETALNQINHESTIIKLNQSNQPGKDEPPF